jgi:adenylosuccinate lyase
MAMVHALSEVSGDGGRFIHLGATSYDIADTATAIQLNYAVDILREGLLALQGALAGLSREHRDTPMLGRTHGQAALPITFGLKMAVFCAEVGRHIDRLDGLAPRVCVGKMRGAVGTGASFGGGGARLESDVMARLGIGVEEASTQIVQRDRLCELSGFLANLVTSCEKFATEVRNLQRTEIGEVSEAFDTKHQVGSSTMPQKTNPILAENICGLARTVRALHTIAYDNAIQWHERDLANSAAERFSIPHMMVLADAIVHRSVRLFSQLHVYPVRMMENLLIVGDVVCAEHLMLTLTGTGLGRQEAHELVRRASLEARGTGEGLGDVVTRVWDAIDGTGFPLDAATLDRVLDPTMYMGRSGEVVDDVLANLRR